MIEQLWPWETLESEIRAAGLCGVSSAECKAWQIYVKIGSCQYGKAGLLTSVTVVYWDKVSISDKLGHLLEQ